MSHELCMVQDEEGWERGGMLLGRVLWNCVSQR